jgi:hypothetical protein
LPLDQARDALARVAAHSRQDRAPNRLTALDRAGSLGDQAVERRDEQSSCS